MLGSTAKSRLRHLLLEISKCEKQIEVLRQVLAEQADFEPYAAYRRLDRKRKGYITELDISNFLKEHDHHYNEEDCTKYIQRYDIDRDGRLSYNEFLRTVLPLDQPDLRTIVTQRKVYDVQYNENLSYDVEYALARLLSQEIAYWKDLEEFKIELLEDSSFTFPDAFSTIDTLTTGYIEIETLKRFLTRDNLIPTDETLICVIRRIDQDEDGKLAYEEFIDAVRPTIPELDKLFTAKLKPGIVTREKFESLKNHEAEQARSLLPSAHRVFTSPLKMTSPGATKIRAENLASPGEYNMNSSIKGTVKKVSSFTSPKRLVKSERSSKRDILDQAQSDELSQTIREKDWVKDFMRIIREIINLERELELNKQDLTLQKDFNLFDFFRVFDRTGSGTVSVGEVEEGLAMLDIYPSREDLYLFIRRFDRDADGRLRFSDFSEAFSPYQAEYFKMLKNRTPVNSDLFFEPFQIFSKTTLVLVKKVIMTHFENETIIEALRQKNERSPHYNLRKVFEYIDSDDDGFVSVYDIRVAMNKNKNFITEKEIHFLFNRFDKDKDEFISFVEFAQELTPKSHKKY